MGAKKLSVRIHDIGIPRPVINALIDMLERRPIGKILKLDKKSMTIRLMGLNRSEGIAVTFVDFIGEMNEVIFNLNIAIDKVRRIPSPSSRSINSLNMHRFFVRMYFYEFGRINDIFKRFLFDLQQHSLITKKERKEISELILAELKQAQTVRNTMVHKVTHWGKDHGFVDFVGMSDKLGDLHMASKDLEEERKLTYKVIKLRSYVTLLQLGIETQKLFQTYVTTAAGFFTGRGDLKHKWVYEIPARPRIKFPRNFSRKYSKRYRTSSGKIAEQLSLGLAVPPPPRSQ